MDAELQLQGVIRSSPWFMDLLLTLRAVDLPQWWVGGGVLRDLVWDGLGLGFDPARVRDVDVAFFDPHDLSRERDQRADRQLRQLAPDIPWEATNQAAVHTWYGEHFGDHVAALESSVAGVLTWPETATAVAVKLVADGRMLVTAVPGGLDDLLSGVCRRNPRRVSVEEYRRRLARRDFVHRWSHIRVVGE